MGKWSRIGLDHLYEEVDMVVNLENAFKFPFKDKRWVVKVLIGGALIWIPIVNFLVLGYLLKILADAKDKKEPILPEWKDWGGLFQEGFIAFVVVLCYSMVLIVLSILGRIPLIGCLTIPLQLAAGFLLCPVSAVALCFYLERKELGGAFDIKAIIEKFKVNIADYLVITLVTGVLGAVSIITLFLAIFIWFYLSVVAFRLYGEAFSAGKSA